MSISEPDQSSFGLACWQGATRGMTAAHRHDDLEFNHADVDLEYLIDGRRHVIAAGTVAVFWAARPHQLVGGDTPGVESWLTVPLRQALAWQVPAGFLRRMLRGEVVGIPATSAIGLGELADRWSGELAEDGLSRRIAEIEIEAFALRMARFLADVQPLSGSRGPELRGPRSAAAAMAAFVSEHSSDDISIADVAAEVHLNPQYAMSVFRSALGITIGDYLTQCRVAAAQQLLLATDRPIPEVGFAAGFQSQSQFYERFAKWCGQSPGVYRRRLRAA